MSEANQLVCLYLALGAMMYAIASYAWECVSSFIKGMLDEQTESRNSDDYNHFG